MSFSSCFKIKFPEGIIQIPNGDIISQGGVD